MTTTLELDYDSIRRELGRFLFGGTNRTPSNWDTTEAQDATDVIAAGLRSFYWLTTATELGNHSWSFLRPVRSITTAASTGTYPLPTDFAAIIGDFTFAASSNKGRIVRIDDADIRSLYAGAELSRAPVYYSVRPKENLGDRTLWEVVLYPVPDKVYELSYRSVIEPAMLDQANPIPLGGASHAETILEAILAAAEKTMKPESGETLHQQRFLQLLAASIQRDQEIT
jgi:hypothetical protein